MWLLTFDMMRSQMEQKVCDKQSYAADLPFNLQNQTSLTVGSVKFHDLKERQQKAEVTTVVLHKIQRQEK